MKKIQTFSPKKLASTRKKPSAASELATEPRASRTFLSDLANSASSQKNVFKHSTSIQFVQKNEEDKLRIDKEERKSDFKKGSNRGKRLSNINTIQYNNPYTVLGKPKSVYTP